MFSLLFEHRRQTFKSEKEESYNFGRICFHSVCIATFSAVIEQKPLITRLLSSEAKVPIETDVKAQNYTYIVFALLSLSK